MHLTQRRLAVSRSDRRNRGKAPANSSTPAPRASPSAWTLKIAEAARHPAHRERPARGHPGHGSRSTPPQLGWHSLRHAPRDGAVERLARRHGDAIDGPCLMLGHSAERSCLYKWARRVPEHRIRKNNLEKAAIRQAGLAACREWRKIALWESRTWRECLPVLRDPPRAAPSPGGQ